jgi:hypothetical protein
MKRLLDDAQLSAEVRDDLLRSRAAGGQYPTAAKLLQLRAALSRADAAPAVAGSNAWQAVPSGWKLLAVAALAGTGALFAAQPATQPATQPAAQPATQPTPQLDVAEQPESPVQPAPERVEAPIAVQPREPAVGAPQPSAAAPARPGASSSRREIAQLVRIRALLGSDPAAALRLAERSEREFPHGLLSEERQALSIVALAKSGAHDAASKRAQRYFARFPHSPMREPISASLQAAH